VIGVFSFIEGLDIGMVFYFF